MAHHEFFKAKTFPFKSQRSIQVPQTRLLYPNMSTFSNTGFGRDRANQKVDDADEVDVNLSHILMLYVGGTIGMKKNKEGVLKPARGYLAGRLAGLPQFHDPTQPLLTTPLSRFGKRIHYEIHEWHQLLDSSNSKIRTRSNFSIIFRLFN